VNVGKKGGCRTSLAFIGRPENQNGRENFGSVLAKTREGKRKEQLASLAGKKEKHKSKRETRYRMKNRNDNRLGNVLR